MGRAPLWLCSTLPLISHLSLQPHISVCSVLPFPELSELSKLSATLFFPCISWVSASKLQRQAASVVMYLGLKDLLAQMAYAQGDAERG